MEERVVKLINFIRDHQPIPNRELAHHLSLSERTIRARVTEANKLLADIAKIVNRRGTGYVLEVSDRQRLDEALSPSAEKGPAKTPSTPEDRRYYLINDLLWRSDWVTIDTLASVLFVSHRTISYDLRRVSATLSEYGLELENRPYRGIRVKGSELSRRICLAGIAMNRLMVGSESETKGLVECVGGSVDEVLRSSDYQISSMTYQNLVMHITIAVARIRSGQYVPMRDVSLERERKSPCWEIAEGISSRISERTGVRFPESEIAYISLHLWARQSDYLGGWEDGQVDLSESQESWRLVSEMIERVNQIFHYDFRDDLELRMNLVRHVEPLVTRLRYRLSTPNPLLSEIREKYPLAYQFASEACVTLNEHLEVTTSDEEIGYIALAFAVALERKRTRPERKNVVIVCTSGAGSARLLELRFRKEFGEHIDELCVCDVFHLEQLDFSNVDYVFSTVPLPPEIKVPVPVRFISFFFEGGDTRAIEQDLTCTSDKKTSVADSYFGESLFLPHLDVTSRGEAITELCEHMSSVLELDPTFEKLVRDRESAATTAFGNLVAMPHPIRATNDFTKVCVGILDREVNWGGRPVKAVFLITVARDPKESLSSFYKTLVRLFSDRQAIGRLIERRSYAALRTELDTIQSTQKGDER